jgi:Coenzyme PQQ synthesis protein D (PqqD)
VLDGAFTVPVAGVIHVRLDDEVIAIDLERGIYYAMVGTAADIWTSFDRPATLRGVTHLLVHRYGASPEQVWADVSSFASQLEAAGLLVRASTADGADRAALDGPAGAPWEAPVLEAHDDMVNLVLREPRHIVDEAGWPHLPDQTP